MPNRPRANSRPAPRPLTAEAIARQVDDNLGVERVRELLAAEQADGGTQV